MTTYTVGQKLWFVPSGARRSPYEVEIKSVGCIYIYTKCGEKIHIKTLIGEGNGYVYSSSGTAYISKEDWQNAVERLSPSIRMAGESRGGYKMIKLPSGRKAELKYRRYNTSTQAIYIDMVDSDTGWVARINKPWTPVGNGRMWLKAEINFNWPQLTYADMADYQDVVRVAFEQARQLDAECVPGQKVL